jgi:hypothetical protein
MIDERNGQVVWGTHYVTHPELVERMRKKLVEKYGYFQPTSQDVERDRWTDGFGEYHEWDFDPVTGSPIAYKAITDKFFADLKKDRQLGRTQLMFWARWKDMVEIKKRIRRGAKIRTVAHNGDTALSIMRKFGATEEEMEYLQIRAFCGRSGCDGEGFKKCGDCGTRRYCGKTCQVADWSHHKVTCHLSLNSK